jgi:ribosomal protein L11 methyltransferase
MKYHVLHITTDFAKEWQKEVFDQELCDLGVDTIDAGLEPEQAGHADYYIPSDLWEQNQDAIQAQISETEGATLLSVDEVPDENWNAVWEAEHPVQELPLGVKIIPHCAFGAGHHETTAMMIEALINFKSQISNFKFNVLDNGCGTGVLGIFAKKLGAAHVLAVDIDDKSVQNTLENAALNGVELDVRLGSVSEQGERSVLCQTEGRSVFDLVLANIHRNILLAQMPIYARIIKEGGEVWMSGFYETDCPALEEEAQKNGLQLIEVRANGEWRMMRCRKEELR